jgi:uncharacterized protein YprB with RNaseH-like and TPR domain
MLKKLKELRCVHRQDIKHHPACFAKGLIKGVTFADDREWSKTTGQEWYSFPEYKLGYLDIETDGLTADFGTMLTWCIKDKGGDIHSSVVTKKELFDDKGDQRLVEDLIKKLWEYKIIITYYGTGFDLPFVRTKALRYGFKFPGYGDIFHWDMYYTVKNKLCLSRNSLANVCDYLGIYGKTEINKDVWRRAKYGDTNALKQVLEHNKGDVIILERLHDELEFSRKWIKKSI